MRRETLYRECYQIPALSCQCFQVKAFVQRVIRVVLIVRVDYFESLRVERVQLNSRIVDRVSEGDRVVLCGRPAKRIHKAQLDHVLSHKQVRLNCLHILLYNH